MAFTADKTRQAAAGAGGAGGPYGFFTARDSTESQITQVSFASAADQTDWGNLSVRRDTKGHTDKNGYCYIAGGTIGSGVHYNVIDRFSVSSSGNAVDVGDLTVARSGATATQNSTYGWNSGGYAGYATFTYNVIDRFTFSSSSNATDWGDTLNPLGGGCSGGIAFAGGAWDGSYSYRFGSAGACGGTWYRNDKIARFSQSSGSNESQISDIGEGGNGQAVVNDGTYAYLPGGYYLSTGTASVIKRYTMGSGTSASSWSDLSVAMYVQSTSQGDDVLFKNNSGYNYYKWSMASSNNAAYFGDISGVDGGSTNDEWGYTYFQDPN